MEVQVPSKDLITSLTTHHHLHTHCLDLSREQEHRGRSTDSRHIKCLQVIDNIRQGVQALLDSESHVVVLGSEELRDLLCRLGIRGVGKTNRERVELWKICHGRQYPPNLLPCPHLLQSRRFRWHSPSVSEQ